MALVYQVGYTLLKISDFEHSALLLKPLLSSHGPCIKETLFNLLKCLLALLNQDL